jgi:cytochrome b561
VWASRAPDEAYGERRHHRRQKGYFATDAHALKLSTMTIRNTTDRWGHASQFLHWLIVVLLIVQVTLANIADDLPLGMKKLAMLARHKSVGITILGLAIIRLLWRWMNPTPSLPDTLKPYERKLANLTHAGLYILLFAMPLSGWTMSSARGFPVSWFGFIQLPDLVPKNKALFDALLETHETLAWALYTIVALHVVAALKHHFMLKDNVLRRMLPFTKTR